jgi:peptidyl-prolyl cis-trans isomerase A (cyclophilin A)
MKTWNQRLLAALAMSSLLAACGGGGGSDPAPAPAPPPQPALPSQVTMTVTNGAGVSGSFVITLEDTKAPATVANFLAYVRAGFFTGTVIHRNSPNFVLQGGGFAGPLVAGGTIPSAKATSAPITLEDNAGLSNVRLTVAMARTSVPDSATSQFFINMANNTFLDRTATARGYAVFGTITAGADFVAAMAAAPCAAWPAWNALPAGDCLPSPNLTITAATQTR